MRPSSLAKPLLVLTLAAGIIGCGRKGDPLPRPRAATQAAQTRLLGLRRLEIILPTQDAKGASLVGVELIRVLYLPLGLVRPTPEEVFSRGEVVLERRRPDLPAPGGSLEMDLTTLQRPAGWLVVVPVRLGDVPGRPSEVIPWLDPAL